MTVAVVFLQHNFSRRNTQICITHQIFQSMEFVFKRWKVTPSNLIVLNRSQSTLTNYYDRQISEGFFRKLLNPIFNSQVLHRTVNFLLWILISFSSSQLSACNIYHYTYREANFNISYKRHQILTDAKVCYRPSVE